MKSLFFIVAMAFATSTFAQLVSTDSSIVGQWQMKSRLNEAKGVDISANNNAGLVDLNSVSGNLVHITGSSVILSLGTPSQAGIQRRVIFDGVNTVTAGSDLVILGSGTSVVTAAGDNALFVADSLTKWIMLEYSRKATAP